MKYGTQPRGIFTDRLRSLSIGNSYVDARPQLFQFDFGERRYIINMIFELLYDLTNQMSCAPSQNLHQTDLNLCCLHEDSMNL